MDPYKLHNGGAPLDPAFTSLPSTRQGHALPVKIPVPSFSTFRAHTPRIALPSSVRRKPLPPDASPVIPKPPPGIPAAAGRTVAEESYPFDVSLHLSPTRSERAVWSSQPWSNSPPLVVRDLDRYTHQPAARFAHPPSHSAKRTLNQVSSRSIALEPERLTIFKASCRASG